MARALPINVQLARLRSPGEEGDTCCGRFREREVGVESGVEGRGLEESEETKKRQGGSMKERLRRKHSRQWRSVSGRRWEGAPGSEEVGCRC